MPTFKTPSRGQYTGQHLVKLRQVIEQASSVGVDLPGAKRASKFADRSGELSHLPKQRRADRSTRIAEVARSFALGELSEADAVIAAATIDAEANPDSAWFSVLDVAARQAVIAGFEALVDRKETTIDALRKRVETLLEEIRGMRDVIPADCWDASLASRAGEDVAAAWSRYGKLVEDWDEIHKLVAYLRNNGILPSPVGADDLRTPLQVDRWGDLLARETWLNDRGPRQIGPRVPVRILLEEICDEWRPGVFTAAEVEAHIAEAKFRVRDERREAAREEQNREPRGIEWPVESLG